MPGEGKKTDGQYRASHWISASSERHAVQLLFRGRGTKEKVHPAETPEANAGEHPTRSSERFVPQQQVEVGREQANSKRSADEQWVLPTGPPGRD